MAKCHATMALVLSGIMPTTSIIEAAGRISCFGLEIGGSLSTNVWRVPLKQRL